jgi:Holliday junction resolvasome RuvABC endonuclease subunit
MGKGQNRETLTLAIYPSSRGFGFVVFEGPHRLIDWGVKEIRGDKNRRALAKARELIDWYKPEAIVLENALVPVSRRSKRIKALHKGLQQLAVSAGALTHEYTKSEIKKTFSTRGASSRYEIAHAVSDEVPDLKPWFPPPRKIWMSENPRMSIFDAGSLAITHFENQKDL